MRARGILRAAGCAALIGLSMPDRAGAAPAESGLGPLLELIETVESKYAGDGARSQEELVKDALGGMVASLDRYSEFLDQQKYKDLQEDTRGSFGGVGIEIGPVNGRLSVIAPIEGTPAEKAGLQGGDIIAFIGREPTDGMKITDAVHRIKGPPGTTVTLTIQRGDEPLKDYVLTRAIITPVNIRDAVLEADRIGYVTIKSFSERTTENLADALRRFEAAKLRGVILDLRGNPGGLLAEATRVADLFLEPGQAIVSTEGRDPAQRAKYYATVKPGGPVTVPLVVLTNEHSASGSEIVAGALKDHGRAVLMGRRTFGKASVQSITPVSRDRMLALRLTVARYYTPTHNEIHEIGVEPDVTLPPDRVWPALRRHREGAAFNLFAGEVLLPAASNGATSTGWLDGAGLKEGKLFLAGRRQEERRLGERIVEEYRRWADRRSLSLTDGEWADAGDEIVRQVRIATMRRVKGEEAARRYSVEFDVQVKAAVALLKLSQGPGGAPGTARAAVR